MRPLRIAVYLLAALAVVVIAFSTSWRPDDRSGARGAPESWHGFLQAYLYASLERQSPARPAGLVCDYPPTIDGARPESGDHATMIGYARCLERLGELTPARVAALERDADFAVANGDWLPFEYAGVTGAARGDSAIAVSSGTPTFDRSRFAVITTIGLAVLALIVVLDVRRRRRGRTWE